MEKLKVGLIGGGGPGSFFGRVHLRALSLDGTRELVAGALRSNPEAALVEAEAWGVRGFRDYQAMIDAWKSGDLELDYAVIATPNHAHFGPAKACLEAGLPVLCEKPMTLTVAESAELVELQKATGTPLVLAHTYTGHPMAMLARELVQGGEIGEVRKVEAFYTQGWLAEKLEESGQQQAAWRTDPAKSGISNCGGDIGTHAFMHATWTTGLGVKRLSARLNSFVEGRDLDDDFNVIAELENGATALITATQIAIGYKNESGFRIYGTTGSLEWSQERAEALIVRNGSYDKTYWIGGDFDYFPESIASYLRTPSGHNEDFFEALANLHCTMERIVRRSKGEDVPAPYPHPGAAEGLAGMAFVQAAVDSSKADGAWVSL
jgi:predicted dehydrogenase